VAVLTITSVGKYCHQKSPGRIWILDSSGFWDARYRI
jgi:hypothetical protein